MSIVSTKNNKEEASLEVVVNKYVHHRMQCQIRLFYSNRDFLFKLCNPTLSIKNESFTRIQLIKFSINL